MNGKAWVVTLALLAAGSVPAWAEGPPKQGTGSELADAATKRPCPEGTRRVDRVLREAGGKPWDRELACEDKKGRKQGLYERYWIDSHGAKSAEGHYQDGKRVGPWLAFWDNGFKAEEGRYESGQRTGSWRYWHSNGRQAAEGRYENDLRDGRWSAWDSYGKLLHHAEYLKGRRVHGEEVLERGEAVEDPGSWDEEEAERLEQGRQLSPEEERERRAREERERELKKEGPVALPRGPWDRKGPRN